MSVKLALKCAAKDDGGIVFLAMDRLSSQGHVIAAEAYLRAFPHQSNARDQKTGVTPLMVGVHSWCCWHSEGSSGLFRFLIDYGADVNAVDIDGNTALHYVAAIASDRREPCAFLLSAGIDPTIKNNEGIDAATLSGGWSGGEKVFREVIRNWSVKRKN